MDDKPVVLAVDDTPENLDVVKGLLSSRYVVKAAINGMMALKIAEKKPPDVILLDIRMPQWMASRSAVNLRRTKQPLIYGDFSDG